MTSSSPDPDPRDTFLRDQHAAEQEIETRDETSWFIHCREADDLHAQRQADAARMMAWTRVITALAGLLSVGWLMLLGWAVYITIGLFR